MKVAILGASQKPERYSHKALLLLKEKGHTIFPIHPTLKEIEGIAVYATLAALPEAPDTITLYLSPANQVAISEALLQSGAKRVIFNPGTENEELAAKLRQAGIATLEACTLVLLRTEQFDA